MIVVVVVTVVVVVVVVVVRIGIASGAETLSARLTTIMQMMIIASKAIPSPIRNFSSCFTRLVANLIPPLSEKNTAYSAFLF